MFPVGAHHLLGIAASGELALVDPPDLVGEAANQVLVVGDDEGGGACAADAIDGDGGALTHEEVLLAEGAIDEEDGRGGGFSGSSGPRYLTSPEALMPPDDGVSNPAAIRSRRFPAPFSPMIPTTVPSGATASKF